MGLNIKRTFQQLAVGLTVAALVGCGSGDKSTTKTDDNKPGTALVAAAEGTIPLGLVASQNGELKPWGEDCVKGAQLAVEEYNKTVADNLKVKLVVSDSGSKPEQGKSAAEKLVSSDKVVCLVGEVASGITAQMGSVAIEKGIPLIAVGATRTDLTKDKPLISRVCYTDAFQGPVMAKFAFEELGLKKVALMTDKKQPYSTGLSDSFRAYFVKLGGEIVDEQFYESGNTSFDGQLTQVKAKNPDGLFMSGYFPEAGPIARQAVEKGLKVKMMGGDGWDSSEILQNGGDAIIGSFFCNHYNNEEDRPEVKEFLSKWKAKFSSEPGTTMGALGYDAVRLACESIKKAGGGDSKKIQEAIQNTVDFKGVSGSITLKGRNGDPPKRALVVRIEKTGQKFAKAYEYDEKTGLPK